MLANNEIETIISNISIGNLALKVRYDGERPYLQVFCTNGVDTKTGEPASWTGRKWMLSKHMCRTEIVRTAYLAYIQAIIHEAQEVFRYKGSPIYSPHFNVEILADVARRQIFETYDGKQVIEELVEDTRNNGMLAE